MTTMVVGTTFIADLLGRPRPAEWEQLREAAEARLAGRELPTTAEEDWKYTDLKPLASIPFGPAARATVDIGDYLLPEMVGTRQVFVNGHHAPHVSCASALPSSSFPSTLH